MYYHIVISFSTNLHATKILLDVTLPDELLFKKSNLTILSPKIFSFEIIYKYCLKFNKEQSSYLNWICHLL